MSDRPTDGDDAFLRDVHALAAKHHCRALLIVTGDLTGRITVSSPIDETREVVALVEHVLERVRGDASRLIAISDRCTHGGKA